MEDHQTPPQVAFAYGNFGDVISTLTPFTMSLTVGNKRQFSRVIDWYHQQVRLACQTEGPKNSVQCKFAAYLRRVETAIGDAEAYCLHITLDIVSLPQWFVKE